MSAHSVNLLQPSTRVERVPTADLFVASPCQKLLVTGGGVSVCTPRSGGSVANKLHLTLHGLNQ